jgi:hypothetical protein
MFQPAPSNSACGKYVWPSPYFRFWRRYRFTSEKYADEIAALCGSYSDPSLNGSSVGPRKRVSYRPVVIPSGSSNVFSNSPAVTRRSALIR